MVDRWKSHVGTTKREALLNVILTEPEKGPTQLSPDPKPLHLVL
jgi:hypothetical protein